jgi:hypothetical protein
MLKIYEERVIEALSKITSVPKNKINMLTFLEELANNVNQDIEGLLGMLCMELKEVVSNDGYPTMVRDVMINEKPHSWR